tara:strand:+ start:779 stop:1144 length:366 start_codon:yes stop_codon:yes gene_type:complete
MHIKRFIHLSKPKQLKTTVLGIVDNAVRVWKSADNISAIEVDAGYRKQAIDSVKYELECLEGRIDDVENGDHFPDQHEQEQANIALWKEVKGICKRLDKLEYITKAKQIEKYPNMLKTGGK